MQIPSAHRRPAWSLALLALLASLCLWAAPLTVAEAANNGGVEFNEELPPRPDEIRASILSSGQARIPTSAPQRLRRLIAWGNRIVGKPYQWGGGHINFQSAGYDCSGTVSYALHGAGLLDSPLDSRGLMRWGQAGRGQLLTVWSNHGHVYLTVAGIRLDTSREDDPGGRRGPRWRPLKRSNRGFHPRRWSGL